ncbi:hypothetical protein HUT19_18040 [Streptomyces sp. NA02950]|uniref:hypothetical protein n=1 Tax=Streptomyces sp. NA02950 TaxID=2742137 RepID=UPI0015911AF4|nr:hypothetical protein [Streptomyces sp. NA02950]QKV93430.1 hypothetical protein HUT19_18040 [Streptomyces sp. NA02950]
MARLRALPAGNTGNVTADEGDGEGGDGAGGDGAGADTGPTVVGRPRRRRPPLVAAAATAALVLVGPSTRTAGRRAG